MSSHANILYICFLTKRFFDLQKWGFWDGTCTQTNIQTNNNLDMVTSEFLKVTFSRSCDRARIFWLRAKSWNLKVQTKNLCIFTSLTVFFFMFHTYCVTFNEIFALFVTQNFKIKVLTAQKNLLLKCLGDFSIDLAQKA